MNENKSQQGEGYDFYDYTAVAFNAVGGAEVAYIAGTDARAAIPLLTLDNAIWPISETYPAIPAVGFPALGAPHDAQETLVRATQACLVRLVSRSLIARWLASVVAGAPFSAWPIPILQIAIPANVWFTLPDKWAILYVVGSAAVAGVLTIKASG